MAPLPRTTLLLAALLSHYHQLTHAMASPWSLLPSLRDHSAECVNGARLPALWFISDLVVTFTGEEPKEASFALGSLKANKASSLVTCRYNRVESGFGCTGQGEGVRVSPRVRRQRVKGDGVVVVIGISEPRASCGARGLGAAVKGEVEVGVDCPGGVAAAGREAERGVCVSREGEGRTVDGVVSVEGTRGLGWKGAVPVKAQGVRNPWGSVAKALVGGGKKMSPLLVELGGKAVVEEKEEEEEEAAKTTEKEMIDAMEEKLCSPSCLRETMPAPESGVVWTNGKKNLQVELRKRRPPSLGRGKPMMW